jgi:hypothetical protein
LILNLYLTRERLNVFFNKINLTIEACDIHQGNSDLSTNATFEIKLDSFHQFLSSTTPLKWLPIYLNNERWAQIEFVCKVEMSVQSVTLKEESRQDFRFVNNLNKNLSLMSFLLIKFPLCLDSDGRSK